MGRQAPVVKRVKEPKSAAVRAALASPPRRQLSKWQRERRQKQLILLAGIVLALMVVGVLGFGYVRETIWRPYEPAAWVHGEKIPIGALAQRVRPQLQALDNEIARLLSQGAGNITPSATDAPNSPARQLQILQSQRLSAVDQVLTDMIDEELIRLEVLRRGIVITPEEIEARINRDLARQRLPPTPAPATGEAAAGTAQGPTPTAAPPPTLTPEEFATAYQSFLARINYTDEQYRAYTEAQLQREKVRDALVADLPRVQEQVHVRRLIVATQEEATAALAQIRSGEATLEELAREKSLDLLSKSAGGDLGWLPRGIESPQFDEAAFRLAVGELSEPVVTPLGWEIIQVLEKAQRPLSEEHLDRLKTRAMDDWLRQARDDPGVRRELTPERRAWVMRQAEGPARRSPGLGS
jgi:parvulin-like peptidyl-prolyl isomerase